MPNNQIVARLERACSLQNLDYGRHEADRAPEGRGLVAVLGCQKVARNRVSRCAALHLGAFCFSF